MTGQSKTTRAQRRQTRSAEHWAAKYAAAGSDPAALASVAWDQLRAAVKSRPPADRAAAWRRVQDGLDELRADITGT